MTRDEGADGRLTRLLEARGALVQHLPLVRHLPPEYAGPLRQAAVCANEFAWIIFTSARGVNAYAKALREEGLTFAGVTARIACVGSATAAALEQAGGNAEIVARNNGSEGLLAEFAARGGMKGKTVLCPQADKARPALGEGLRELGVEVTSVVAYRTEALPGGSALVRSTREADAVLFCSPSATEALRTLTPGERQVVRNGLHVGSMGPATSEALRQLGIEPDFEPEVRTFEGLADALARALS
ncbi:MAG: uroporphyrinogen methyltransferase / synthase [Candidatus Sumerlaeota bacterium]|nr:uroporphyrinogen methyltransferase / synthase [Candidatus Sumerlaeota bacterium]